MATPSRLLGEVKISKSGKTERYEAAFLVSETELQKYEPEIYDPVDWTPVECVVSSYSKAKVGEMWQLTISAEPEHGGTFSQKKELYDFVTRNYATSTVYFHSSWWGVRKASPMDADKKLLNVAGNKCGIGEYVFKDATASSKGTPDYKLSPFSNNESLKVNLIDQEVKTMVYCVIYYSTNNINSFTGFTGVNGGFSGNCRPFAIDAGKWKVLNQKLRNTTDKNGKQWVEIYREMQMAPLDLKWDAAKNGGTWKW
jgi:hypothetical protein